MADTQEAYVPTRHRLLGFVVMLLFEPEARELNTLAFTVTVATGVDE